MVHGIILLNIVTVLGWYTVYHPLKHRPLRLVLGWFTVDIILLNLVLLG